MGKEHPLMLRCYLDGNAICIVGEHFENIQESNVVFVQLNILQLRAYKELATKEGRQIPKLDNGLRLFVAEKVDRDIEHLQKESDNYLENERVISAELKELRRRQENCHKDMIGLRRAKTWFDTHPDG